MNYQNYEVPENLIFETKDIVDMGGLKCGVLLTPADFKNILTPPEKIKKAQIDLTFSVTPKDILVKGEIKACGELRCSRCLKLFSSGFEDEFTRLYSIKDEIIDIMCVTKQSLALLGDIQNLCSKDCKGLCGICGCDKNVMQCGCKPPVMSQFACLKNRFNKSEGK